MDLSLDVATDIYPIQPGQNLTVQIVSSLGGPNADADKDAWRMDGGGGLADEFDYVMHGKVRLLRRRTNVEKDCLTALSEKDLQIRRLAL